MIINNSPSFQANLKSPKLRFKQDDFFVPIRGYGKDNMWSRDIKKTADFAVDLIRKDTSAENVLKIITLGVKNANSNIHNIIKRQFSGILRTEREGWLCNHSTDLTTPYTDGKYKSYKDRLDYIAKNPLKPLNSPDMSRPQIFAKGYSGILHGSSLYINRSLDKVFSLTNNIFPKFIHNDIKPENLEEVNNTIAEIRWILAHSTPWIRGSDAISNVFMRVIYKSIGVKSYPLKKGVSLDLEAYCTELQDYKKKFPAYFEKPPEIID